MMNRVKRRSQLYLVLAAILLTVLFYSIGVTGAWFTCGDGLKVECTVIVGQFNLKVSQVIDGKAIDLNTYDQTVSNPQYVDITKGNLENNETTFEILPDEPYTLNLQLTNTDQGTDSFYLRYKITLYKCSKSGDVALNAKFSGETARTDNAAGFVQNGEYYEYRDSSGLVEYGTGTSLMMCTGFSIPYSEFYNNNYNGETVRLEVLVECSDTKTF